MVNTNALVTAAREYLDDSSIQDALESMSQVPQLIPAVRHFALWCARRVQPLMSDLRSVYALEIAERYLQGEATDEELEAALVAADATGQGTTYDAGISAAWAAAWAASSSRGTQAETARRAAQAASNAAYFGQATTDSAAAEHAVQITKLEAVLDAGRWVEDGIS